MLIAVLSVPSIFAMKAAIQGKRASPVNARQSSAKPAGDPGQRIQGAAGLHQDPFTLKRADRADLAETQVGDPQ